MLDLDSHSGAWAPVLQSPAPWLHLFSDGSFQAGESVHAQHSAVSTVIDATQVLKAAGEGKPIVLIKGQFHLVLMYRQGQWLYDRASATSLVLGDGGRTDCQSVLPVEGEMLPDLVPLTSAPSSSPGTNVPSSPESVPARPKKAPAAPTRRRWPAILAPLLLIALMLATSTNFAPTPEPLHVIPAEQVVHVQFDENTWVENSAYHTLCTHAFFARHWQELAYLAGGILLFGWLVQRNVGFWRTMALFLWSAALSVGLWRFLHTELGQAMLHDLVRRGLNYLAEKHSLATAWTALVAFSNAYDRAMQLHGPITGAAGAVSGLILFAVCRRPLENSRFPGRLVALVVGAAYIACGWAWLWPDVLRQPVPYMLFIGGALAGWCFCFPDKALGHVGESLKNALTSNRST